MSEAVSSDRERRYGTYLLDLSVQNNHQSPFSILHSPHFEPEPEPKPKRAGSSREKEDRLTTKLEPHPCFHFQER